MKKITSALISVYNKDHLEEVLKILETFNVDLYSTGGTYDFIVSKGYKAQTVESLTGYPSILGGRVKTLHPKIFGGILAQRDHLSDINQMEQYEIPPIDLVIVDLYPFEETIQVSEDEKEIIEKIDIGGISLIRAAAKNYKDVVVISSIKQYDALNKLILENNACTTEIERKAFAAAAFAVSSNYDICVFNYFNQLQALPLLRVSANQAIPLRYGENPHQQGFFYGDMEEILEQLHGKAISYNNLLDIEASISLINDFTEPTAAIIKHNNACGIASRIVILSAWGKALEGDPISAFGGIIITNFEISIEVAKEVNLLFYEILIAPSYQKEALDLLQKKKNRIILKLKNHSQSKKTIRTLLNGFIEQDRDIKTEATEDLKLVTKKPATENEINDLLFANKIVKHSKSNAIVLVKNRQLLASGVGQTSRVDALHQAIAKAKHFGFDLNGAVMASDAFFPFSDCVEIAKQEGITAVIQPGGSIKDDDSIKYCNANQVSMYMTGFRHFKH